MALWEHIPGVRMVVGAARGIKAAGTSIGTGAKNAWNYMTKGDGADAVSKLWNDYTGQSAVDRQLQGEKDLMTFQNEMNRQNLVDSASLQKEGLLKAGLNTALAYGGSVGGNSVGSVANHGAPLPMSGAEKLDKLLGSIQGVQGLMNNQYQLAANNEALKQKVIDTALKKETLLSKIRGNEEAGAVSPFGIDVNSNWSRPFRPWLGSVTVINPDRLEKYQDSYWNKRIGQGLFAKEQMFGKAYENLWKYGDSSFLAPLSGNFGRGHAWLQRDYLQQQYDLLKTFGKWDKYANYISKGIGAIGDLAGGFFKGIGKLKPPKTYTVNRR